MKSVSISFVLKWFILPFQATAFVLLHNMKRPLGGQSFKINTVLWFIIVIRLTRRLDKALILPKYCFCRKSIGLPNDVQTLHFRCFYFLHRNALTTSAASYYATSMGIRLFLSVRFVLISCQSSFCWLSLRPWCRSKKGRFAWFSGSRVPSPCLQLKGHNPCLA